MMLWLSNHIVKARGVTKKGWSKRNMAHYMHFREECIKNIDTDNYYGPNDDFPFNKIKVDKATRDQLNENALKYLEQMGVIL